MNYLRINYPEFGIDHCVSNLPHSKKAIQKKIRALRLTLNHGGVFWKDFQSRAAKSKVGKKRPGQRAVLAELRDAGRLEKTEASRKKLSEAMKRRLAEGFSPPSAKGRTLSVTHKKALAEGRKQAARDPNHITNSKEFRQAISDRTKETHKNLPANRLRTRGNGGYREDIGIYVRSTWEANVARHLNKLVADRKIRRWEYEPKTFSFSKIKRGCRSYTPDFRIYPNSGKPYYIEVKGWMDQKSRTKLKRMSKYFPKIKIIVWGKQEYEKIKADRASILGWE